MSAGNRRCTRAIADCTSAAALSMSRLRSNCNAIEVEPCELVALIVSMPEMVENCLMSGVATELAIVSGEAPGSEADTLMVGNSVRGSAATGRNMYAKMPLMTNAADINVVATGWRMQNSEMFICAHPNRRRAAHRRHRPCAHLPVN